MVADRYNRLVMSDVFDGRRPIGRIACGVALLLWGCTPINPADGGIDAGIEAGPDREAADTADAPEETRSDAPPPDAPPSDAPRSDASPSDVPPTDVPPSDVPPSDVALDVPADLASDAAGCRRYTRGPIMVAVPNGCIDSTEVTQAQYQVFLAAKNNDVSGQGPECTWNPTYGPALMCGFDPIGQANLPVNGVDWCDATAYCRWAGKRLCGHVGGGALIETDNLVPTTGNMQRDLSRADVSEWTAACSQGGLQAFPYGGALVAEACNGAEHTGSPRAIVDVGTMPGCVGGYPGLFDMAGNVHEWEGACAPLNGGTPGKTDECWFRGGSYHDPGNACTTAFKTPRDYVDIDCDIGIRCCADP